jgi:hypothetical protein
MWFFVFRRAIADVIGKLRRPHYGLETFVDFRTKAIQPSAPIGH